MSLTIATKTYAFDTNPTPDSARYYGPAQTAAVKDSVVLKRTAPKAIKDFAGICRSGVKTVKSVLINGITRDCIAETFFSWPVGSDAPTVTALRVDHASFMSSAPATALVDKGTITN